MLNLSGAMGAVRDHQKFCPVCRGPIVCEEGFRLLRELAFLEVIRDALIDIKASWKDPEPVRRHKWN